MTYRTAELISFKSTGDLAIRIDFPYSKQDVSYMHQLEGRRFHERQKCWTCPLSIENIQKLDEWGFELDPRLEQYRMFPNPPVHEKIQQIPKIKGLRKKLYPFQAKGVSFIESRGGRALVADEMGLGKTVQALAWLQLHPDLRPVIVVVPASVKLNWKREAIKWMDGPRVTILSGTTPYSPPDADIYIINYDILHSWIKTLRELDPQVLITDECHFYKSNKAKRTKAVKMLGKTIPHIIALSGTPIVNRPVEVFNAIKLIDPTAVPTYWEYVQRYCGAYHDGFGWNVRGATNTEELHERLTNSIMIRRKKSEVLKDLPDKIRSFVPMEMDNADEYWEAEDDFIAFIREQKGKAAAERASNARALAEIEGLRQLAVKKKMHDVISWIEDFLETDNKLVVFATHKFVIKELIDKFGNIAVKVDGSVTGSKRQEAVDRFQDELQIKLFVGNIGAAGIGITLTAAYSAAFIELPWTPGELDQAEDRIYARLNDLHGANIYYLLADNTIEERIAKLIDRKRKVLDAVLDGEITEQESMLSELMKDYDE